MAFPRLLSSLDTWNSFIFSVCVCVCRNNVCTLYPLLCTSSSVQRFHFTRCVCVRDREKKRQIHAICLWASVLITAANWAVKPTSVVITHLLTALWAALLSAGAALTLHAFQKSQVRLRSVRDKFLFVVFNVLFLTVSAISTSFTVHNSTTGTL